MASPQPTTIVRLLAERLEKPAELPALLVKRAGQFVPVSWAELGDDVFRMAAALSALGVQPGDRVAQFCENRHEWIVLDLATAALQAIHVPLHASLSGPQAKYQIEHSGARAVVIAGDEQAAKLAATGDLPGTVEQVLAHDTCGQAIGGKTAQHLHALAEKASANAGRQLFEQALESLSPEALATILYTSGTTGEPKGVMLSHGNLTSNALAVQAPFELSAEDVGVCLLPLSHVFARTCDLYTWLSRGGTLALAERRETALADVQAVRPTVINAVPYFYEKIAAGLVAAGQADVPGAVQAALGGRIRLCCSGGAALPVNLFDFYNDRGMLLTQGYGLTETSPVITASGTRTNRRGSVGPAVPGVEVRIADDGEILTRGPHVMQGYWRDDAATAEMIQQGWLHTGDLGRLDEEGYLFITGRKKEMIVTTGGKNVAPMQIETLLCSDPLIAQAMVVGEGRKCLGALVVPDPAALSAALEDISTSGAEPQAPAGVALWTLLRRRIDERLAGLSRHEQIGPFVVLPRGFTLETGEITAKGSLRRAVIAEHFAEEIEALYGEDPG